MPDEPVARFLTVPTPEGPAYYPLGSWGPGYVMTAQARARMNTYLRYFIFVMAALLPVADSLSRSFGADALVSGFCVWTFFCAVHAGVIRFILRDSKTTSKRVSSDELLRLSFERRGALALTVAGLCLVIIFAAITFGFVLLARGWERWVFGGAGAIASLWALRQLSRIQRLDAEDERRRDEAASSRE